mmetsp:Transcript_36796/g.96371  ORF Transcript_36796/g.96371 Transcript_36796/m.96371 type:complete len:294 (+) Transcript_36796:201-1082(+)
MRPRTICGSCRTAAGSPRTSSTSALRGWSPLAASASPGSPGYTTRITTAWATLSGHPSTTRPCEVRTTSGSLMSSSSGASANLSTSSCRTTGHGILRTTATSRGCSAGRASCGPRLRTDRLGRHRPSTCCTLSSRRTGSRPTCTPSSRQWCGTRGLAPRLPPQPPTRPPAVRREEVAGPASSRWTSACRGATLCRSSTSARCGDRPRSASTRSGSRSYGRLTGSGRPRRRPSRCHSTATRPSDGTLRRPLPRSLPSGRSSRRAGTQRGLQSSLGPLRRTIRRRPAGVLDGLSL